MSDEPETTPVEQAMAAAEQAMAVGERTARMVDSLQASLAACTHVRWAWDAMANGESMALAVPPEIAQWHLIQVHMRAVAAWNGQ